MTAVTGYSAERMKAIEDASVVDGHIDENSHLILTRFDESEIDAGDLIPRPADAGGFTIPGRFVGYRTTAGPPTTGTWLVGDFGFDMNGRMWLCTASGTPGTWVDMNSGRELGYVAQSATQSTTSTTAVDVPGLVLNNVPIGTRPVSIVLSIPHMNHSVAAGRASVVILEDGVIIGGFTGAMHATATRFVPYGTRTLRRNPAAGNHTYKVQFWVTDAGTFNLTAGVLVGVDYGPLSLSVIER